MTESLRRAHLDITGVCNLNCKHCHVSEFRKEQMHLEQIVNLLRRLREMGVERVALSGGEPLIRKDLFYILNKCPRNISILTNGTLVNDSFLEELRKFEELNNKILTLRVSLDGLRGNMQMRDYDGRKVFENIRKIRDYGFVTVVNTMASQFISKGELGDFLDSLEAIKVDKWNVDLPYNEGSYKTNKLEPDLDMVLPEIKGLIGKYLSKDYATRLDVVGIFSSERIKLDLPFPEILRDSHPCAYQFRSVTINPKGSIQVCPSLHVSFGDALKEQDLTGYRESEKFLEFFNHTRESSQGCKGCKYLQICGGGCRANALSYTGDLWGKDTISCQLMEFLEKDIVPIYPSVVQAEFKRLIA